MAQFWCKCGNRMWNGQTPNDIQFWVYSDRKMDKIRENDVVDVLELSDMEDYEVWLCPVCKRLSVFEHSSNTVKYTYQLE